MSLLGTQVYANPSTPCWVSSSGDTINGNLVVTGTVTADEGIVTVGTVGTDGLVVTNPAGAQQVRITHLDAPGRTYFQSTDQVLFGQIGQGSVNSSLTVSAPGANADVLSIGGQVQAINGGFRVYVSGNPPVEKMVMVNAVGQSFIQSSDVLYFTPLTGVAKTSLAMAAAPADDVFSTDSVVTKKLTLESTGVSPTVGTGVLALGTAIINTDACDVTSYIQLTHTNLNASTAVGTLRVVNKLANSFTVESVDALGAVVPGDLSDFDWVIFNPA